MHMMQLFSLAQEYPEHKTPDVTGVWPVSFLLRRTIAKESLLVFPAPAQKFY